MARRTSSKGQLRDMIYKAYLFYLKEKKQFEQSLLISDNIKNVEERTAKATGVSINFLRNILRKQAGQDTEEDAFNYMISLEYHINIRRIIHKNILNGEGGDFSISHLKTNLKSASYQISRKFLKNTLKKMGYEILKIGENKKILTEKSRVRLQRIKFIKEIKNLRDAGSNIVYVGDNFVCNFPLNCTENEEVKSINFILVHAYHNNAFLPGAFMLHKSSKPSLDSTQFYTWVQNQLIPSLPSKSIIVVENQKLHNEMFDNPPHAYSKRKDMIAWLQKHDIPFNPKFIKVELYYLIKKNKASKIIYTLDDMLKEYEHTVLRLPKFHSDLNPINAIWIQVRDYLSTHYIKDMTMDKIETLITEKLNEIGDEIWKKAFEDVIEVENNYMEFEHQFDDFTDNLIINNFKLKETSLSDTESCESDIDYSDSDSD